MSGYSITIQAAIDHQAAFKKQNLYLTHGAVIGGVAGRGFSLLGLERKLGKKTGMERILIKIGDESGVPVMGISSYFHIEIDEKKNRIAVELSQMQRSLRTENELKQQIGDSHYVSLEQVIYDPQEKSTSLVFKMKQPLKVEVFSPQKVQVTGRIVLDLLPLAGLNPTEQKVKR